MQILALISIYAPVAIIVLAVVPVVFSFFWVLPSRGLPKAMSRLLVRFRRRREGHRRR